MIRGNRRNSVSIVTNLYPDVLHQTHSNPLLQATKKQANQNKIMRLPKTMKLLVPISLPLLAMAIGSANAALVLTNGNFQADTVALNATNTAITSWFESSTSGSNFADYLFHSTTQLGAGSTTSLSFEATTSYVYQSLGTTTGSEASITVSGTAIDRYATSGGGRTFGAATFQLFSGTPGSSGDGIALTGLTSLGTFTISESAGADLNLGFGDTKPETGTAAQSALFTTTAFDLSALAPGTQVWLQISAPTSGTSAPNDRNPILDDLSINVAIPEPSTTLLGGLGLLMLLRRRR